MDQILLCLVFYPANRDLESLATGNRDRRVQCLLSQGDMQTIPHSDPLSLLESMKQCLA
jgi:hypothetical protein